MSSVDNRREVIRERAKRFAETGIVTYGVLVILGASGRVAILGGIAVGATAELVKRRRGGEVVETRIELRGNN